MRPVAPKIVGIVNITADSFSDGGICLEPGAALAHAKKLLADGADSIELGAASSNPYSEHVPPEVEIERLAPVLAELQNLECHISIDTTKKEVQCFALEQRVDFLNDIRGFPDEDFYGELRDSTTKLVVMHFISGLDKAVRVSKTPGEVFDSVRVFFDERLKKLSDHGIPRERIIIDPGMGFFLASNPEPSLAVLAHIADFKRYYELPVMVSVSRKSFLRNFAQSHDCDIQSRTLSAELFAAAHGADYIRTHDVRSLHQALATQKAIEEVGATEMPPWRRI